jgi:CRP-like cAMP-binding protein
VRERPPIPFDAVPILTSLSVPERAALALLCELTAFDKGATIFREGGAADRIHFLFLGRVKIVKSGPERDLILEILGPGEPVGAVAAFERRPFPASVVAIEPSGLISIPKPLSSSSSKSGPRSRARCSPVSRSG